MNSAEPEKGIISPSAERGAVSLKISPVLVYISLKEKTATKMVITKNPKPMI